MSSTTEDNSSNRPWYSKTEWVCQRAKSSFPGVHSCRDRNLFNATFLNFDQLLNAYRFSLHFNYLCAIPSIHTPTVVRLSLSFRLLISKYRSHLKIHSSASSPLNTNKSKCRYGMSLCPPNTFPSHLPFEMVSSIPNTPSRGWGSGCFRWWRRVRWGLLLVH